jgi:hypothetical protein
MNEETAGHEEQIARPGELVDPDAGQGGRPTNSPPVKRLIQTDPGSVLASGVDSLTVAVDFFWRDSSFFRVLDELKAEAVARDCPMPGLIKSCDGQHELAYEVKPFGKDGYSWVITSPEFSIKLGNWMAPRSRPSAMIDFRAEILWMHGVVESIDRIITLLKSVGAMPANIKASRIDLCLDLLIQAPFWCRLLEEHVVTRAKAKCARGFGRGFSGLEIGSGELRGRLYDKDLEIRMKSKKFWMFDIWNINEDELPEELRVIRIEFQLRREALKELGIDSIWSFVNHPRNLWAYCTHCWLQFTDNPETETRFQETLPFWKTVQDGFLGGQCGTPLIRAKAVNVKKKQLAQQMLGQLTSLIAIDSEEFAPELELEQQLPLLTKSAALIGMDDDVFSEKVRQKQGKYLKAVAKFKNAETARKHLGLPRVTKESVQATRKEEV